MSVMNTQIIGLIGVFSLALVGLVGYIVLAGLGEQDAADQLAKIVAGFGIATAVQGAALIRPGGGSS